MKSWTQNITKTMDPIIIGGVLCATVVLSVYKRISGKMAGYLLALIVGHEYVLGLAKLALLCLKC